MNKRSQGNNAESIAVEFILGLGYSIVKRNFHFGKVGEIDIVAKDNNTLVFIEVKSRSNNDFGTPESAVTPKKQASIRRVAEAYLHINDISNVECRFDVIAIDTAPKFELRHIINAF